MPAQSQDQLKAMAAAMTGKGTTSIPPKVGVEYVKSTPKGVNLPKKVGKKQTGKDFNFTGK